MSLRRSLTAWSLSDKGVVEWEVPFVVVWVTVILKSESNEFFLRFQLQLQLLQYHDLSGLIYYHQSYTLGILFLNVLLLYGFTDMDVYNRRLYG